MRVLESTRRLASIRTRRSLVPPPEDRSDPKWEASWRFLFEQYTPAMQRYVRALLKRAAEADPDTAADVVQDFLARCLEKGWLSEKAGDIRCFRAYLQTQLRRFTHDHLDWVHRKKRHPPGPLGSEEELRAVSTTEDDPAALELDRGWVDVAIERALATLAQGNETYHAIIDDLLRTDGEGSDDLAERLARSPRDVAYLKYRARARFAKLFAEELRATVRDDGTFEELLATLSPFLP
jgi:DNA-directed RNA polymerase specialized sigma24 family protein